MRRILPVLVIVVFFGIFILLTCSLGYHWYRNKRPPDQPIAFPHTIHATRLGLACNFCHIFVNRSRHAGAPPVEKCMTCHEVIATDKEEIKKLTRYWEQKQPIEWNRVYSVPDYVYFSHKRHVSAGVDCSECHGNVGIMEKVRRVSSLKMGWCVSCHKVRGAPLDCTTCHH